MILVVEVNYQLCSSTPRAMRDERLKILRSPEDASFFVFGDTADVIFAVHNLSGGGINSMAG